MHVFLRFFLAAFQISNIRAKLSRDRLSSIEASIGSLQVCWYWWRGGGRVVLASVTVVLVMVLPMLLPTLFSWFQNLRRKPGRRFATRSPFQQQYRSYEKRVGCSSEAPPAVVGVFLSNLK